jgi:hypothetical protein
MEQTIATEAAGLQVPTCGGFGFTTRLQEHFMAAQSIIQYPLHESRSFLQLVELYVPLRAAIRSRKTAKK